MSERRWRRLSDLLDKTPKDKQELLRQLQKTRQGGVLSGREMEMIEGVLSMSEWQIRNVMLPKNDIVRLSVNDDYHAAVQLVCATEHSRYPVFEEDGEHVCGILMAKDLLRYVKTPSAFVMKKVMRAPILQPESKNLDAMLDDFRRHRTHMVVVVDEYALPVGIVTIEDVLERIVGEIEDEFDDDDDKAQTPSPDGGTIIKGSMSVEEFNVAFNGQLPEDGADTVAGWLAAKMERLPAASEVFVDPDSRFIFEVIKADDRRIYTLKITGKTID